MLSISIPTGELKILFDHLTEENSIDMEENLILIIHRRRIEVLQLDSFQNFVNQISEKTYFSYHSTFTLLGNVLILIDHSTSKNRMLITQYDRETFKPFHEQTLALRGHYKFSKKRNRIVCFNSEKVIIFKWNSKISIYEIEQTIDQPSNSVSINSSNEKICLNYTNSNKNFYTLKIFSISTGKMTHEYKAYSVHINFHFSNKDPDLFVIRDEYSIQLFQLKENVKFEDCLVQLIIQENPNSNDFCFSESDEYLYSVNEGEIFQYDLNNKHFGERIQQMKGDLFIKYL
jgi:uncharacterized protein YsxB (DUF464 family)